MSAAGILTALAVILRITSNSFLSAAQKKLAGRIANAFGINFCTFLLLSFFLLPGMLKAQYPLSVYISDAVIAGTLGALGNAMLVFSLRYGELSVLGPVNAWKPVVGLAAAFLLLHEFPSAAAASGVFLVAAGSLLILGTGTLFSLRRRIMQKDILLRIGALILTASEAAFIKRIIHSTSVEFAFGCWCFAGAVFSFAGAIGCFIFDGLCSDSSRRVEIKSIFTFGNCFWLLAAAVSAGLMQYSTNLVFAAMAVGPALALFQLSNVLNLFFGHHFFGEGEMLRKAIGTAISAAGAVLIVWKI
jgi:uncharacterized membrane protein